MGSQSKKPVIDINGIVAISDVILYGYLNLKPKVKWTYCSLLAVFDYVKDGQPNFDIINIRPKRLANAFQMPYSTLRSHLKDLQRVKLIEIQTNGSICLLPFSELEVHRAMEVKKSLTGKKYYVNLMFTKIPKSLFYSYPGLNSGAKLLFAFYRSLDFEQKGYEFHREIKFPALLGIHIETYLRYKNALLSCNLIYQEDVTKPSRLPNTLANKDTIFFNDCIQKEQERAVYFLRFLFSPIPLWITRDDLNYNFTLKWHQENSHEKIS